jgi:hypothetical protein
MQDVGVEMLTKAIAKNTALTQLQLSHNKIGDRGAQALAAVSAGGIGATGANVARGWWWLAMGYLSTATPSSDCGSNRWLVLH